MGSEAYDRRQLSDIKYIVIHHSAVDADSTPLQVAGYHVQHNGWPGIGYHFQVTYDGTINYVGDLETVRYNVASRNRECVGVELNGDFTHHWPTDMQLGSARVLLAWLKGQLAMAAVVGHKDIALPGYETSCPGDTWYAWRDKLI